ncbi:MAG: monovalent cation/H+ antiporter complex subunit F [Planctomycetota bacterium]|nr:monovalent cation/H+ antiporter complex subunit F [Planctomycetota bacterium]
MHNFWLGISIIIAVLALMSLYRAIKGPTLYDRIISLGVIGTKTVIILCLIGLFYRRLDMFVDISIVYALLNFLIVLAVAKYIHSKEEASL